MYDFLEKQNQKISKFLSYTKCANDGPSGVYHPMP